MKPGTAVRELMKSFSKYISLIILLCALILPANCHAADSILDFSTWSKEKKVIGANLAGVLFITTWGVINWDYGQTSPHAESEGWFEKDTKEGGADKLGHFYDAYVVQRGLSLLYESWGYKKKAAAYYGFLSSFGIFSYMEFGDSFSDFGFSYEDFIMNFLGSGIGYLIDLNPDIASKIDFRIEIEPDLSKGDFFTDYENHKYLMAIKLDGFDFIDGPLEYLELHTGYYGRGYSDSNIKDERNVYVGLGINLSKIFADYKYYKTSTVLNYLQIPFTSLQFRKDLN